MQRELELIEKGTPCYINYFDENLLTVEQGRKAFEQRGYVCPNMTQCESSKIPCLLRVGLEMAGYVQKGSNLRKELMKVSNVDWLDENCWASKDGKVVTRIRGKSNSLKAIEYFARVVLLEDTSESVLNECKQCRGVKLEEEVHDSVWFKDGPGPCSGGGETRKRVVEYCPNCEKKPRGGIIMDDSLNKGDEFFRKLSKHNY